MKIKLDRFIEWLENKNLKERTIENYVYYFNKFTYDIFNQETVSQFLANKTNRNVIARSFIINFQKYLSVNYRELGFSLEQRTQILEVELPAMSGRTKKRIIDPIPKHQIKLIEENLADDKYKMMLMISYYCALRVGELLKIRIMDFNWDSWRSDIEKMGECRVFGKGDKEGIALVPSFIMKRMAQYIRSKNFSSVNSYVFITGGDHQNVNIKNRSRLWQKRLSQAGVKAGITKFDNDGKPVERTVVHPHRLRHSYASYLLNEKGLDIREVQEILRHSSIQSTQIYTHVNKDNLKTKLSDEDIKD